MSDIMSIGAQGMNRGMEHMNKAALEIARTDSDEQAKTDSNRATGVVPSKNYGSEGSVAPADATYRLAKAVVSLHQAKYEVASSAQVVKAGSDTLGLLIDTFA